MTQDNNNLTYSQKVALDGEIAFAIATSNHNDEVLFRMYSILSTIEKDIYPYILNSFEEMANIPEDKMNRIRAEIALGKAPVWIWENKCVSDLKECIKISEQMSSQSSITADQKMLRGKLVVSAFIFFIRKVAMLTPKAANDLCVRVSDENGLECLHTACAFMLQELKELETDKRITKETFKKLMEMNFDLRDTLSFKLETKALDMLNKNEGACERGKVIVSEDKGMVALNIKDFNNLKNLCLMENNTDDKDLSETLEELAKSDDIIKTLMESAFGSTEESTGYVVKKIFNGSNKTTTLETFSTKKEAEEFIKDILSNMPELSQTYTFVIEHQIK